MSSGLAFDEDYGDVTDVTRMLYLEPDMAAFAAGKPLAQPVGSHFNYSSGSSVLLARLWQDAAPGAALDWPRAQLFGPLGMRSAVMEADARGTFVGSSYLYATGRDWARFGLLLLQDGQWDGRALLPPGWVQWMSDAVDGRARRIRPGPDLDARAARRCARRARTPMPPTACPPTRCGCAATTASSSPSCPRASWWWCAWG